MCVLLLHILEWLSIFASMPTYLLHFQLKNLRSFLLSLDSGLSNPSILACHFNYFYILSVLIIAANSCNVCMFYFCIFSNKLDLFEATCFLCKEGTKIRLGWKREDIDAYQIWFWGLSLSCCCCPGSPGSQWRWPSPGDRWLRHCP